MFYEEYIKSYTLFDKIMIMKLGGNVNEIIVDKRITVFTMTTLLLDGSN